MKGFMVADADEVDLSNLQRQILHSTEEDVGRPKAKSAKETVDVLNPDVEMVPYVERLTSDNILDIIYRINRLRAGLPSGGLKDCAIYAKSLSANM